MTSNTDLQLEIVRLQNLIYRMALLLDEYHMDEVDIEGRRLLDEAREIQQNMTPVSDTPTPPRGKPDLRIVGKVN